MTYPTYSVLMSLYKKERPEFLDQSLASVMQQTILPDEIILVLDGPVTGPLQDVILKYDNQLTVLPLETNKGLGLALNEGLSICSNELVARMDTDDIMKPERCQKQLECFMKDPELTVLGTQIDEFEHDPEQSGTSRIVPTEHDEIVKFSRRRNPFNHPTVMYRKSRVQQYGGYNDIRRNQDFDLFVRMIAGGEQTKNIGESLLYFRANTDNLKRRKSWQKVSSDIRISNNFRKMGHASWIDFLIVSLSHLILFLSPTIVAKWLSENLLRKKSVNQ